MSKSIRTSNGYIPPGSSYDPPLSPTTPARAHTHDAGFPIRSPIADAWKETPLPKDGYKIRLLKLHGGREEDLMASLIVRNGQEPYEALSYTWGKEPQHATIRIYAGGEIHKVGITPNLEAALRHLRFKEKSRLSVD